VFPPLLVEREVGLACKINFPFLPYDSILQQVETYEGWPILVALEDQSCLLWFSQ